MKKSWILIVGIVLGLAGCSKNDTASDGKSAAGKSSVLKTASKPQNEMDALFELDYSPENIEPVSVPKTISRSANTSSSVKTVLKNKVLTPISYENMENESAEKETVLAAPSTVPQPDSSKPLGCLEATPYYNNYSALCGADFVFNTKVDLESFKSHLKISNVLEDYDRVYIFDTYRGGCIVRVSGLLVESGLFATVKVLPGVKNIYGQELELEISVDVKGRDHPGFIKTLDSGSKMLEAQFPHKLLIAHKNAKTLKYKVEKNSEPLDCVERSEIKELVKDQADIGAYKTSENQQLFEEIDLEPFLVNGKGAVSLLTNGKYFCYDWNGNESEGDFSSELRVQVTDLAATVRIGLNKAVILVKSLSSDNPVSDAKVTINSIIADTVTGKTDKNGIAVLDFKNYKNPDELQAWSRENFEITVSKGDDTIIFKPSECSHNNWRHGVDSSTSVKAMKRKMTTFMFTDRGIYRPGETVTFRGIDKNLYLGSYSAFKGSYRIELIDYSGWDSKVIASQLGTTSESGGFFGSFNIPETLKPGTYQIAYLRVSGENDDSDGERKRINFTVSNFKPLKIQSKLEIPQATYFFDDEISAKFEASYLAGGALSGAKFDMLTFRNPTTFTPKKNELKDYYFSFLHYYEGIRNLSSFEGRLDENGQAEVTFNSGDSFKSIPYEVRLEMNATDVSNQKISTSKSVIVHPAEFYVGIKKPLSKKAFVQKGENVEVPLILVTPEEEILSDSKISSIKNNFKYKLSREYWTRNTRQSVNSSMYSQWTKNVDVEEEKEFTYSKSINISPKEAGFYNLVVYGTDSSGKETASEIEFYVTGKSDFNYSNVDSRSIKLTPDQSLYNPGDTAHILLEAPLSKGDYLITVEREGIFTQEVRHLEERTTVLDVKIARNYLPVVYVSVASYSVRHGQPEHNFGETDFDKPHSVYGVTPIFVNPQVRAFSIDAKFDKESYAPGENATITFTATRGGKPVPNAELTVMGVDRAVIDLINYHVPNPISFFYNPDNFPLYCSGCDSREYLMDPVTYSIKNLQGGDSELKEKTRDDFRYTAFFEPALMTDENGKATYTFKTPSNLSTFRMTAFGICGELLALQEDEFIIQNPVNVQSVQPKKLRPGDKSECGVLLTNLSSSEQEIKVSIKVSNDDFGIEDKDNGTFRKKGNAVVNGELSKVVKVKPLSSSTAYFEVEALEEGFVKFEFSVDCEALKEKLVSDIEIERTYVTQTQAWAGSLNGLSEKSTKEQKIAISVPSEKGTLSVTLDPSRLGILSQSVNYLFDYPYGCMEQQSARILPLVIFSDYIKVFSMESKVSNPKKVVKNTFKKWRSVQLSGGGFPYWPTDTIKSNFYVSARIAHIYKIAKDKGYKDSDLYINIDSLLEYLDSTLESSFKSTANGNINNADKYYACYVLSLFGKPAVAEYLEKLIQSEQNEKNPLYKNNLYFHALTALSCVELEKSGAASELSANILADTHKKIMSRISLNRRSVNIDWGNNEYNWWWNFSKTSTMALLMKYFISPSGSSKEKDIDKYIDGIFSSILLQQKHGYWTSTVTTAFVLDAVNDLIKGRNLENTSFACESELAGNKLSSADFNSMKDLAVTKEISLDDEIIKALPKDSESELIIRAKGTGSLYYEAVMTYEVPPSEVVDKNEGIALKTAIYDNETGKLQESSDGKNFKLQSGKTYRFVAQINPEKSKEFVALRIAVPSGCEILDSQYATTGSEAIITSGEGSYSNTSILDNEVQFFWDEYFSSKETKVEFTFRAERRGFYPTAGAKAECMYESEIYALKKGYDFIIE